MVDYFMPYINRQVPAAYQGCGLGTCMLREPRLIRGGVAGVNYRDGKVELDVVPAAAIPMALRLESFY